MTSNRLDWTHAFTHRLEGLSVRNSSFSAKLDPCAARLKRETETGLPPFLTMPYRTSLEAELPLVLERIRSYRHMVLLGIGGSALGARALQKAFAPGQDRPGHNGPWLWIADNIDVDTLSAWTASLDPKDTVVTVVSKSGGTLETMAQYFLLRRWLRDSLGDSWKEHVVIVTDAGIGELRAEATAEGLLSMPVPDHLGGRYSIFSAVGLLPAAFLGVDWKGLLRGAASVAAPLVRAEDPVAALGEHPAWQLAVWSRELMEHNYSELIFFCYIPLWSYFGAWFGQLWAESLGKEGKGSMPLPAIGVTDQHSLNQMFLDGPRNKGCLFLTCDSLDKGPAFGSEDAPPRWSWLAGTHFGELLGAEGLGTCMALTQNRVPLTGIAMGKADEEAAGRLMGLCMSATLLTGWLLRMNPLDQPAVELGKRLANARLGAPGYDAERQDLAAFIANKRDNGIVTEF